MPFLFPGMSHESRCEINKRIVNLFDNMSPEHKQQVDDLLQGRNFIQHDVHNASRTE